MASKYPEGFEPIVESKYPEGFEPIAAETGLKRTPEAEQMAKREMEAGLLGGTGQPMSREEAIKLSRERMAKRGEMEGGKAAQLKLLTTPDTLVGRISGMLGGPKPGQVTLSDVGQMGTLGKGISGLRSGVSGATFGLSDALVRLQQDAMLEAGLTTPEAVEALGLKAQKEQNPIGEEAGQVAGSVVSPNILAPLKIIRAPATAGQKILAGGATGATGGLLLGTSSAIEKKGLSDPLDTLSAIPGEAAGPMIFGTALGGGIPGALSLEKYAGKHLKESAIKDILSALSPAGAKDAKAAQRIAPRILEAPLKETFALTAKGIQEKASQKAKEIGQKMEETPLVEGKSNVSSVIQSLNRLKQDVVAEGNVINPEALARINKVEEIITQFGDEIQNSTLQKIKKSFDSEVYGTKGAVPNVAEKSLLDLKKDASDNIRGILAEADPDFAKLNKSYNFHKTISDLMERRETRLAGKPGLLRNLAGGAAATTSGTATGAGIKFIAVRALYDTIKSPSWKIVSAKMKNRLADALTSGNEDELAKSLELINKSSKKMIAETTMEPKTVQAIDDKSLSVDRFLRQREMEDALKKMSEATKERTPKTELLKAIESRTKAKELIEQAQKEELLKQAASKMIPKKQKAFKPLPIEEEQLIYNRELLRMMKAAKARQELLDQMRIESSR